MFVQWINTKVKEYREQRAITLELEIFLIKNHIITTSSNHNILRKELNKKQKELLKLKRD